MLIDKVNTCACPMTCVGEGRGSAGGGGGGGGEGGRSGRAEDVGENGGPARVTSDNVCRLWMTWRAVPKDRRSHSMLGQPQLPRDSHNELIRHQRDSGFRFPYQARHTIPELMRSMGCRRFGPKSEVRPTLCTGCQPPRGRLGRTLGSGSFRRENLRCGEIFCGLCVPCEMH